MSDLYVSLSTCKIPWTLTKKDQESYRSLEAEQIFGEWKIVKFLSKVDNSKSYWGPHWVMKVVVYSSSLLQVIDMNIVNRDYME